jgi:hypothetical protein
MINRSRLALSGLLAKLITVPLLAVLPAVSQAQAPTIYTYHPRADRNLLNSASVWGSMVGYDTLTIVVKEFWPDIRRKLSHKAQTEALAP